MNRFRHLSAQGIISCLEVGRQVRLSNELSYTCGGSRSVSLRFLFPLHQQIISLFQIYYLFYNSHKQLCLLGLRFRCTFHCLFAFLEIINCITSAEHASKAKVNISSSNYARLVLIPFQCVRHKYSPIFLLLQFVTIRVPLFFLWHLISGKTKQSSRHD